MQFEPIAIVGRACILPDAFSPEALWKNLCAGRTALARPAPGRWRYPDALGDARAAYAERAFSDIGGYIEGFQPKLPLPASFEGLDPVFVWSLCCARDALAEAANPGDLGRAGLVLGNLSFPTTTMLQYANAVWLDSQGPRFLRGRARELAAVERPRPENRFMSGLPALKIASELGLGAGAHAIDAACASSLYALKLACDRLHAGQADLMLAGAVNAADLIVLHVGFSALAALSRSGQSRPFSREADGLVPAEGAAFVALKRLADAERAGDRIWGVIRSIGLSNDGRARGLLVPSAEGQLRAMQRAYALSGLAPRDISFVECHATGTSVGDATELQSMQQIFTDRRELPIGSIKANLGHPVTASGLASLLKVLSGMEAGLLPPMPPVAEPLPLLQAHGLRPITAAEPWPESSPRRAAISAFGFGGNNAHMLLEQYAPERAHARVQVPAAVRADPVAVVGMYALAGDDVDPAQFEARLFGEPSGGTRRHEVALDLAGLRFPPNDLSAALPHQAWLLHAARRATRGVALARDTTSVIVGMGTAPDTARFDARRALADWCAHWGHAAEPQWLQAAQRVLDAPLQASSVLGHMPNVFANRINSQLDLAGPSLTVSAEELSGNVALDLAIAALQRSEIDAAVVGAVDLSDEHVHRTAIAELDGSWAAADGVVVLVLKRLSDAQQAQDPVLALISPSIPEHLAEPDASAAKLGGGPEHVDMLGSRGAAHTASGLLQVASAVVAVRRGLLPTAARIARPWLGPRRAQVFTRSRFGQQRCTSVEGLGLPQPPASRELPVLETYAGSDRAQVLQALRQRCQSETGPARLVIVALPSELESRRVEARRYLELGGPLPEGIGFASRPIDGELAFVFTGAAAAYPGMADELLVRLPALAEPFTRGLDAAAGALAALQRGFAQVQHPLDQLWACSLVCQSHARLTREVLKLAPQASLGYSSGESNQLFAFGAWDSPQAMLRESFESPIFQEQITGSWTALASAWAKLGFSGPADFRAYAVSAEIAKVRAALADEPLVHITIVNTPSECVIGGQAAACQRVLDRLGAANAVPLPYRLAAHCPELEEVREGYFALHQRPTHPVPGVRFYWGAWGETREPTELVAAEALTQLATTALDFPRLIERAYADGVRVFVEHGPRGLCSAWIERILGDRPHLAVALDTPSRGALAQLFTTLARLSAAQIPFDMQALIRALAVADEQATCVPDATWLRLPAHRPDVQLPNVAGDVPQLPAAPQLAALIPHTAHSLDDVEHTAVMPRPEPRSKPITTRSTSAAHSVSAQDTTAAARVHLPAATCITPTAASLCPAASAAIPAHHAFPLPAARAGALHHSARVQASVSTAHQEHLQLQAQAHASYLQAQLQLLTHLARAYPRATGREPSFTGPLPSPTSVAPRAALSTTSSATSAALAVAVPTPQPTDESAPEEPITAVRERRAATSSAPHGPRFDRAELLVHAGGNISEIFGPAFRAQDAYARQVRMPQPPLLLADRVTGIVGEPMSLGTGTIWTETDVTEDSWYLHCGRMPAGVMIEAGQADLMLASWLGVDQHNRGERVYRLLGCDLTYHAALPVPGDVLTYDIHIDSHANQGDIRLFFFHYDCHIAGRRALSVRNGQAGFFSDAELRASTGVLWSPQNERPDPSLPLATPVARSLKTAFDERDVRAFAAGDAFGCFGEGFERACSHVATPTIATGDMLLFHRVSAFDPDGGPWGRGYLRVERDIRPDDWFFAGHFKNDPCMPGTLMFEGCLQAMSFYLAALGFTLDRDGYRFEPALEQTWTLRCRGQVQPSSKLLSCEIFVEALEDGPTPTLQAHLLGTIDGLKAFHARSVSVKLVPDWPLERWRHRPVASAVRGHGAPYELAPLGGLAGYREPKPVAQHAGFAFDYASLLACAWGRPSFAFGPLYARFDGTRRAPRLPGPPYHFMSRVVETQGTPGEIREGASVVVEYDVPEQAWYFDDNGAAVMPMCVLMEAMLQPCGWLASYVGSALLDDMDLLFRNLDGTINVHAAVTPGSGALTTRARLRSSSRSSGMIIQSFEVECSIGGAKIADMQTVFGFFPKSAFENQTGLPVADAIKQRCALPAPQVIELTTRPARYFEHAPRVAAGILCMLDRITAHDPRGGAQGLGYMRAEKLVDPREWFFKAHFFQDPVQPGSLGIEALCQLLQLCMVEQGLHAGLHAPHFEPVALRESFSWKYRGQVVPSNARITTEIELTQVVREDNGVCAFAEAWLWVDGKPIYQAKRLGMRVVEGPAPRDDERSRAEVAHLHAAAASDSAPSPTPKRELLEAIRKHWRGHFGLGGWPVEDLYLALASAFVGDVHVADAQALAAMPQGSALYLANHQVGVESLMFSLLAPLWTGTLTSTLAKAEHQHSWLGKLCQLAFSYPGARDPQLLVFFEREDRAALPGVLAQLASDMRSGRSAMIHVEGTRALQCRAPVQKLSAAVLELAIEADRPVVPVRFAGALPVIPASQRLEFPYGCAAQSIWVGRPIAPGALRALGLKERKERVLQAMNELGPSLQHETPNPPNPALAQAARDWQARTGALPEHAMLMAALRSYPVESPLSAQLLSAADTGQLCLGDSPAERWLSELAKRLFGPRGPVIEQR